MGIKAIESIRINGHSTTSNSCQSPAQQPAPSRTLALRRRFSTARLNAPPPAATMHHIAPYFVSLHFQGSRRASALLRLIRGASQRSPAPAAASATKPLWAGPDPPRGAIVGGRDGPDLRAGPDRRGAGSPRPAGMRKWADSERDLARAGRAFSYVPVETNRTRLRDGARGA